jgi:predicted ATP-binding protein involved in virulence
MLLKKIEIEKFRNFEKTVIELDKNDHSSVFSIASCNGGGKSTLLQFVFTMLRCFVDKDKHVYIQNLLANIPTVSSREPLAKFVVESNGMDHELAFIVAPAENFNLIVDLEEAKNKFDEECANRRQNERFLDFKQKVNDSKRVTAIMISELVQIRQHFKFTSKYELNLYENALHSDNIDVYKTFTDVFFSNRDFSVDVELEPLVVSLTTKLKQLQHQLEQNSLSYICHLANEENVLLLQSTMPKNERIELSRKIYLTASASQVFLFLSAQQKQHIFKEFHFFKPYKSGLSVHHLYEESIVKAKTEMEGFFTYDFAPTDLILKAFQKAFEQDLKVKLQTKYYGNHYDQLVAELGAFLEGKEIAVDEDFERVIFSLKDSKDELGPEDLSHGELKKLSLYVWLKHIVEKDAIILMDEVDIALHPRWQYEITKDLVNWSGNSQFILATHSPQILSSTYYKNLIKLVNTEGKTSVIRYGQPPVDRDINTTVTAVMDAPDLPADLKDLHKNYRHLVDSGDIETPAA